MVAMLSIRLKKGAKPVPIAPERITLIALENPACTLGARALADADDAVLVWVEDLADLAHGLGVGGGGGEVSVGVQAAKQAAPAVVAVGRVGQAPRHQRLALQRISQRER